MAKREWACPECKGTKRTLVQYRGTPEDYDGTSEIECDTCGARWGRWTGKRLREGELELRYGGQR